VASACALPCCHNEPTQETGVMPEAQDPPRCYPPGWHGRMSLKLAETRSDPILAVIA
jgi:hypothetical protein